MLLVTDPAKSEIGAAPGGRKPSKTVARNRK
jgi:hypothetical protein